MLNLITDYPILRISMLTILFGIVALGTFYAATAGVARQMARRRLNPNVEPSEIPMRIGSLRSDKIESAWLTLVNGIEMSVCHWQIRRIRCSAINWQRLALPPLTLRASSPWFGRSWCSRCRSPCLACSG